MLTDFLLKSFAVFGFFFVAVVLTWLLDRLMSFHLEGMERVRKIRERERERGRKMSKWIACGSVTNPKKAGNYIRFSSKVDWQTEIEAQNEAKLWEEEKRYSFIWVEKVG